MEKKANDVRGEMKWNLNYIAHQIELKGGWKSCEKEEKNITGATVKYDIGLAVEIHKVITVTTMDRFDSCFACLITVMLATKWKKRCTEKQQLLCIFLSRLTLSLLFPIWFQTMKFDTKLHQIKNRKLHISTQFSVFMRIIRCEENVLLFIREFTRILWKHFSVKLLSRYVCAEFCCLYIVNITCMDAF